MCLKYVFEKENTQLPTFSKVENKRKRAYEMGDVLSIDPLA